MSQPSARPSLIAHSMAVLFATGRVPGCARQVGQVRVFSSSPQTFSQLQNIFVRVFSWTWISSPMTASHSGIQKPLGFEQRHLDVPADFEDRQVLLECAVHADQAELALAGLQREADVV